MYKQMLVAFMIVHSIGFTCEKQRAHAADSQTVLNGGVTRTKIQQFTSEDFREMQYGVIGIMVKQSLFDRLPVIVDLLPECPAALAGLQKGDQLVRANDHKFGPGEGQTELIQAVGGVAGTKADVTVLREGEKIHFPLVRMNVEDIADDGVKLRYEQVLTMMKKAKDEKAETN
jgi:C-terminal processing protease CtpA/Prc